jgi:hypothetical protein
MNAERPVSNTSERSDPADGWRERRRILLATVVLTVLYLALQRLWWWGAHQLGRSGYSVNNPTELYADEAASLAARSRSLEAERRPQLPAAVFETGLLVGYLNQWLGAYGSPPPAALRLLRRPVDTRIARLQTLAGEIGIGRVELLPMRTAADYLMLTERLETDVDGTAARLERATSPRLRHLFLLGAHVGTQWAALESATTPLPIPATTLIGKHATLAGLDEDQWRPLARLPAGRQTEALQSYRDAILALEHSLNPERRPPEPPNLR